MTMKEYIKQNICDENKIRANIKLQHIIKHTVLKKATVSIIACLIAVSVGLGVFFIVNRSGNVESGHSEVELFSDGKLLYFTNTRKGDKLYSYDPDLNKVKEIINEPVSGFYANNEYYFYNGKEGFYCQDRETAEKYIILDYAEIMPERRIKELDGGVLLETPQGGGCCDFFEYEGSLYFVCNMGWELKPDEHATIGNERWSVLYRFDITDRNLTELKRSYYAYDYTKPHKDIYIRILNVTNDKIYYSDETDVCCSSLDGKQIDIINTNTNGVFSFDLRFKEKFYYFKRVELDLASDIPFEEQEQNTGIFFNAIDLNGEMLFSYKISADSYSRIDIRSMYYDNETDSFLAFRGNELIRFTNDPDEYTVISKIEDTMQNSYVFKIITVGKTIYIAAIPDFCCNNKSNDYYIMTINEEGKLTELIKNGKIA